MSSVVLWDLTRILSSDETLVSKIEEYTGLQKQELKEWAVGFSYRGGLWLWNYHPLSRWTKIKMILVMAIYLLPSAMLPIGWSGRADKLWNKFKALFGSRRLQKAYSGSNFAAVPMMLGFAMPTEMTVGVALVLTGEVDAR